MNGLLESYQVWTLKDAGKFLNVDKNTCLSFSAPCFTSRGTRNLWTEWPPRKLEVWVLTPELAEKLRKEVKDDRNLTDKQKEKDR